MRIVATATTKAIAWIADRSGNGSPLSISTGMPEAAARVTTPRMPVHETTIDSCQVSGRLSMRSLHCRNRPGCRSNSSGDRAARRGLASTCTWTARSIRRLTTPRPNIRNTHSGRTKSTTSSTTSEAIPISTNDSRASRRSSMMNRICRPM